ncbi:hypothetical protein PYCC9005_005538 [Savitreella phatthalungensis]
MTAYRELQEWSDAVGCIFIDRQTRGDLADEDFNRWLYEDALYVRAFAYFLARLLVTLDAQEPSAFREKAIEVCKAGYASLSAEHDVFVGQAIARGVVLPDDFAIHNSDYRQEASESATSAAAAERFSKDCKTKACAEYVHLLCDTLDEDSAEVRIWMLLAIEDCYFTAWRRVRDGGKFDSLPTSVRTFVDWWSNDGFGAYVQDIRTAAESAVLPEADVVRLNELMRTMLKLEKQFFDDSLS